MSSSLLRPQFTVIEGSGRASTALFDLPGVVLARSPHSRKNLVAFRLATGEARRALDNNRRQPVYDLWSGVLGAIPPQAGASLELAEGGVGELRGMSTAHACFRGIGRPVGDDERGFDYLAYVHRAPFRFEYRPSMSRCVQLERVPDDLLFVTYVKLDYPDGRIYGKRHKRKAPIKGIITHWDYVESDSVDSNLPVNFETRFRRREW